MVIINLFQLLQMTGDTSALQEEEAKQWSLSAAKANSSPLGLSFAFSEKKMEEEDPLLKAVTK